MHSIVNVDNNILHINFLCVKFNIHELTYSPFNGITTSTKVKKVQLAPPIFFETVLHDSILKCFIHTSSPNKDLSLSVVS